MTTAASLVVEISGRSVNLIPLINQIEARLRALDAAAQKSGAGVGGALPAAAQRASGSFLSLQSSIARLEVSEGNLAGAAQRLRNVLAQQTSTTTQVINARRQLIAVDQQLATGQSGLARAFSEAGAAGKASLAGLIGPAALATAGISALVSVVRSFADALAFKAELDATTASINAQLSGVRDSSAVMAEASAFGREYKLTQQEQTEAIAASVGVMRNSKAAVEDILSVMARLQILSPEQSLQEAAIAMKALAGGDSLSLQTRFEVGRDEAALMKEEIRGGADAVVVLGRHLDSIGIGMEALKAKTTGVAGAIKDVAIAQEELTLAQARWAEGPGLVILQTQTSVLSGLTRVLSGDFTAMGQSMTQAAAQGTAAFDLLNAVTGRNAAVAMSAAQNTLYHQSVLQGLSGAALAAAAAQQQAAAAAALSGAATSNSALQSLVDAEAKQLEAQQTQILTQETKLALDAFLQLNPGIDAAGIAALVTAGKIDPLLGQLAAMRLQAYEARDALIALANAQNAASVNATVLANRSAGKIGRGDSSDNAGMDQAWQRINDERNKAIEAQILATGTAAQKQDLLNKKLADATRLYGANSAAAIGASTALLQFQQSQTTGGKSGGGGGGGGTRLSDQSKLNNTLLADQQKFNNKFADEELNHAKRLIDIAADAAEKRAEAMNAFNQDALDSRASFYLGLADVENAGLQKAMSERFEAIQAEAARIEQQSGADAALAFENAATAALEKQSQIQQAITKAQEEGDGGKAEFLTGVLAAQVKADEARLERIKASGSAIATEEAKQQADEIARYEEQVGKVTTAADRAALAKITAAQRGGQAVDAEALRVDNLVASYERLGTVSTRGGIATTPPAQSTPAAPTGTAATPAALVDLAALQAALQAVGAQVTAAIQATERAVKDGATQVSGAVSARAFS